MFPTSYDSRYASDPFFGLDRGVAFGRQMPPASEFKNRLTGHHPPEAPISQKEWTVMQLHSEVAADYGVPNEGQAAGISDNLRMQILAANDAVRDAMRNTSVVKGMFGTYRSCLKMSKASAGAIARDQFNHVCVDWAKGLELAEGNLDALLVEAGDIRRAEVAKSQVEETETIQAVAKEVAEGDPDCNWWCVAKTENPWLGTAWTATLIGVPILIAARVVGVPMFGEWLKHRDAQGEQNQW